MLQYELANKAVGPTATQLLNCVIKWTKEYASELSVDFISLKRFIVGKET